MMFEGTVTGSGYETRDGYTFGDTVIQGTGAYEGHQLHISPRSGLQPVAWRSLAPAASATTWITAPIAEPGLGHD